ncbi:MAG: hypothetical protein COA42_02440 [Alteromonadaceae bacterium]|nr:MAG: hypothetical protein COA42_02440 [Alteromonadaceae bacterium]
MMSYRYPHSYKHTIVLNMAYTKNHPFGAAAKYFGLLITFYTLFAVFIPILSVKAYAAAEVAPQAPAQTNTQTNTQTHPDFELYSAANRAKIEWLEAKDGKFSAFWEPDSSGNPYGAVLIIHDHGQHADWPHTVNALRESLSPHGWAALSISVPPPSAQPVPKRPPLPTPAPTEDPSKKADSPDTAVPPGKNDATTPETTAKTATDSAAEADALNTQDLTADASKKETVTPSPTPLIPQTPPEEIVNQRMKAAFEFLNAQGQFNIVVIGLGIGAGRAIRYLNDSSPPGNIAGKKARQVKATLTHGVRALIFIDPRNQLPESDMQISDFFNAPNIPILDIHFGQHHNDALEAKVRRKEAKKKRIIHYYQIKMMPPSANTIFDGENRLTRRVRGFLNKHARGVEIEDK